MSNLLNQADQTDQVDSLKSSSSQDACSSTSPSTISTLLNPSSTSTSLKNESFRNASSKKDSSKNALKAGIYTNRLLSHEDPELLKECVEGFVRDFEVTSTTGYQLAQELAQVILKLNRLEVWQAHLIETHLAKHCTRIAFITQLHIQDVAVDELPDWYFNGCQESRANARDICTAMEQLEYLIELDSDAAMLEVQKDFPELWSFIVSSGKPFTHTVSAAPDKTLSKDASFAEKLASFSKQSDHKRKLQDLHKHFLSNHMVDILWAQSEERFENVLTNLRAQVQMDLLSNPSLHRGEMLLHRRKTELLSQLFQHKREFQNLKVIDTVNESEKLSASLAAALEVKPKVDQSRGAE